jgi:hypothetical protein
MLRADHLVADLTDPQRAKLAGIQTDPRARAILLRQEGRDRGRARPRIRDVEAHARRDGDDVTVWSKGLALQLTPNNTQTMHHQEVGRIRAHERATITRALEGLAAPPGPWDVTIARQGPRTLDSDNATASAKGVRDAVAAWLGVDDGEVHRVRFVVVQKRDRAFGVVITVKGGAAW